MNVHTEEYKEGYLAAIEDLQDIFEATNKIIIQKIGTVNEKLKVDDFSEFNEKLDEISDAQTMNLGVAKARGILLGKYYKL